MGFAGEIPPRNMQGNQGDQDHMFDRDDRFLGVAHVAWHSEPRLTNLIGPPIGSDSDG